MLFDYNGYTSLNSRVILKDENGTEISRRSLLLFRKPSLPNTLFIPDLEGKNTALAFNICTLIITLQLSSWIYAVISMVLRLWFASPSTRNRCYFIFYRVQRMALWVGYAAVMSAASRCWVLREKKGETLFQHVRSREIICNNGFHCVP